jgi:hypothetical protein
VLADAGQALPSRVNLLGDSMTLSSDVSSAVMIFRMTFPSGDGLLVGVFPDHWLDAAAKPGCAGWCN